MTSRRACHPGGAGQEEEALLSEMDVTGQAFEDMQEQNLRLLQQLREKDDANFKLMSERIKANQIHKLLREEKDELAEQVLALKAQVGPKCPGKTQGFGEVQGDVGVQENQDGWRVGGTQLAKRRMRWWRRSHRQGHGGTHSGVWGGPRGSGRCGGPGEPRWLEEPSWPREG